jgi:hypothetical protein
MNAKMSQFMSAYGKKKPAPKAEKKSGKGGSKLFQLFDK